MTDTTASVNKRNLGKSIPLSVFLCLAALGQTVNGNITVHGSVVNGAASGVFFSDSFGSGDLSAWTSAGTVTVVNHEVVCGTGNQAKISYINDASVDLNYYVSKDIPAGKNPMCRRWNLYVPTPQSGYTAIGQRKIDYLWLGQAVCPAGTNNGYCATNVTTTDRVTGNAGMQLRATWAVHNNNGLSITTNSAAPTTFQRTTSTVTATFGIDMGAQGWITGTAVRVEGVSDSSFNGTFSNVTVSGTTVTWTQSGANTGAISGTGSKVWNVSRGSTYSTQYLQPNTCYKIEVCTNLNSGTTPGYEKVYVNDVDITNTFTASSDCTGTDCLDNIILRPATGAGATSEYDRFEIGRQLDPNFAASITASTVVRSANVSTVTLASGTIPSEVVAGQKLLWDNTCGTALTTPAIATVVDTTHFTISDVGANNSWSNCTFSYLGGEYRYISNFSASSPGRNP